MTSISKDNSKVEDYFHYFRTCWGCGNTWWGLHCPHDGYQNPCPECGEKPKQAVITNPKSDTCDCEFVAPTQAINLLLQDLLDSIGEPKLGDFDIKPESYDDVVKCVKWYKDRIKELSAGKRDAMPAHPKASEGEQQ